MNAASPVRLCGCLCRRLWQLALYLWAAPASLLGLLVGGMALVTGGRGRRVGHIMEFYGGFARVFLCHIARGPGAMTLGHVVLGQNAGFLDLARDHELVHVRQYERWGPFFLPAYGACALWLHLHGRHGYWENPFEREAYALSNPSGDCRVRPPDPPLA